MCVQIAQRKYEETRSRVQAQRARQEQKKQEGTTVQRIAGRLCALTPAQCAAPSYILGSSWLHNFFLHMQPIYL